MTGQEQATTEHYANLVENLVQLRTAELTRRNQKLQQELAVVKQAEHSLRERYHRLELGIAATKSTVYDWDIAQEIVVRTGGLFELLGYHPEDVEPVSSWWVSRIHPEEQQYISAQFSNALADETHFSLEYRMHHRQKGYIYVSDRGLVIRDAQGKAIRVVGSVSDISERKQVEAERDRLFSLSLDMVCIAGFDGFFKRINLVWEDVLGYPANEVLVSSYLDFVHPDDYQATLNVFQQLITGTRVSDFENRYRCKDGTYKWLLWSGTALVESGLVYCTAKDITQRKQMEEALMQQHELLQKIMDCIPVMIDFSDPQGKVHWANREWQKVLGWSVAELEQGSLMVELYPDPNDRQYVIDFIRAATGRWHDFKTRTRYGTIIDTSWANIRLSDGSTVGIGQDITERKRAEEALRQQGERERLVSKITRNIRQSLNLGEILTTAVTEVRQFLQADRVVIYDFNLDWSGSIVAESVASPDLSLLGRFIHDPCFATQWHSSYQQGRVSAVKDVETANLQPCHRQLLTSLQVRANLVIPIIYGETLWGLLIAHQCSAPQTWQDWQIDLLKQLTEQLAIAVQQSELYEQVQRLNFTLDQQVQERTAQLGQSLEFEALLKRITDKVRDSLDESYILQTVVEELCKGLVIKGCNVAIYDLEQYICIICYEFFNPELPSTQGTTFSLNSNPELYSQLLQGQYCQFCQLLNSPESSQTQETLLAILACPIADEQGVLGDLHLFHQPEISFNEQEIRLVQQVANQCAIALRQSRLYQAAQAQVTELERLNRLKNDFLSTVSHELRTPMAAIKLATQMLEMVLEPTGLLDSESHQASRYFQILDYECQREINLINDLLDLSRLDAGIEPLELTTIDPTMWLPTIVEPFLQSASSQKLQFQVNLPESLPCLTTDLSYLGRILTELLNNACKYTPVGGMITLTAQTLGTRMEISISNSGVEIAPEERQRIFDRFYRIPNSDPWKHGGTGLGLALVKKIVELLRGTVEVNSLDGQTTFRVVIPITYSTVSLK